MGPNPANGTGTPPAPDSGPSRPEPRWPVRVLVLVGDVVVLLVAVLVARDVWLWLSPNAAAGVVVTWLDLMIGNPRMPPATALVVLWWIALRAEGLYDPWKMTSSPRIAQGVFRSMILALVAGIVVEYFLAQRAYSRLLLVTFDASAAVMLVTWRLLFFRVQSRVAPGLVAKEGVLVVGTGADARLFAERLARYGSHLYAIQGYLAGDGEPVDVDGPVLGRVADLRNVVNRYGIGFVVIAAHLPPEERARLASVAAGMGLEVLEVPFTWGLVPARIEPAVLGELELVRLGGLSYTPLAEHLKRAFDLVAVTIGGLPLLPLLLFVALLVKLEDGGPVLYVSERAGRGGRSFRFYKFRSMVPDADRRRDQLPNEADGRLFKMQGDPRITRVGGFIRRWSVDELPQLLNVLKGDMNLVGPRPLPMRDLAGIEDDPEHRYWFEQRSRVNPGITGLWQVTGRSDLSFARMVELDVYYIQHWNLFLDLVILLRTLPAVLRGRGAR